MKLLSIFFSSLAVAGTASASRQLLADNLSVGLTSAIADASSNTLTYTWNLGSEIVVDTNFDVLMFPLPCWSGGEATALTAVPGIVLATSGIASTITWTDAALFGETKDSSGVYDFCLVARSTLGGDYVDFEEVVTTLTVNNLGDIEGVGLAVTEFQVGATDVAAKEDSTLSPEFALEAATIAASICGDSPAVASSTFIKICITQNAVPYAVHLQAIDTFTFTMAPYTQNAFVTRTLQSLSQAYTCTDDGTIETCEFQTLLKADFFKEGGTLLASGTITLDDTAVRKLRGSSYGTRNLAEDQRDFSFEIDVPNSRAEPTSAASGLIGATLSFLTMAMANALFVLA